MQRAQQATDVSYDENVLTLQLTGDCEAYASKVLTMLPLLLMVLFVTGNTWYFISFHCSLDVYANDACCCVLTLLIDKIFRTNFQLDVAMMEYVIAMIFNASCYFQTSAFQLFRIHLQMDVVWIEKACVGISYSDQTVFQDVIICFCPGPFA